MLPIQNINLTGKIVERFFSLFQLPAFLRGLKVSVLQPVLGTNRPPGDWRVGHGASEGCTATSPHHLHRVWVSLRFHLSILLTQVS